MSGSFDCEGPLYLESSNIWNEAYCIISGTKFQAFRKIRDDVPASRTNKSNQVIMQFDIFPKECDCKRVKFGLSELTKIMKNSKFSEMPYYFSSTVGDNVYMLAASTEQERARWIIFIKNLSRPRERGMNAWISTGFLEGNYPAEATNRFGNISPNNAKQMLPSQRQGIKVEKPFDIQRSRSSVGGNSSSSSSISDITKTNNNNSKGDGFAHPSNNARRSLVPQQRNKLMHGNNGNDGLAMNSNSTANDEYSEYDHRQHNDNGLDKNHNHYNNIEESKNVTTNAITECGHDDDDDDEIASNWLCCKRPEYILGIKVDTIVRLLKVASAFPFVIVVSALNFSNKYAFLRSVAGIRTMNILIYVAPFVYVRFVLSQSKDISVQRLAIGLYILLYLFPVGYVVFSKVKVASSTSNIEEGTFCFKPARTVRFTQANLYALLGFIFEWLQHTLYVLPLGIVASSHATKLSDYPPYLSFEVYFWTTLGCILAAGLVIVLNAVLRGKLHYKFQNSFMVWFFVYNVGSPMFVTFVTIMFMSLWCDYSQVPATLIQQPDIVCYSDRHIVMARAALVGVAMYIIQHTLLPSGTFKETMRDNDLDIMFVPVYLQAHFLLKAVFCAVYVYFYQNNIGRVIVLTIINVALLCLNNFMKPCSVGWINVLRDAFFVHATLSGIQSLNYLAWPISTSTKGMVISTLASNVIFSSVGMYLYYKYFSRSTEYTIATAFLDLEWQVSRGGSVHPRVLEPLISLTLSNEKDDWDIAKNYIGQLVWLISYPNMRVQFQSAWGLANLALLDEDARLRIHQAGGTKTLFEWYTDMGPVVQLEVLAAMANLTLSMEVAEDMVVRHKCVPFFIDLAASNKLKHSQFATIALSNLARKETFRELIRRSGGIATLVSCIMSQDYQKRRHGARALANMALSPSKEIEQVFESVGLLDRILKMALRKEIETQREVIALIRNLSCHARLRPLLLDRGVMEAIALSRSSIFEDVLVWCEEITILLEKEISGGSIDLKALIRREGAKGSAVGEADIDLLKKMDPLKGQVEWSTWGSKLESIFQPVFSTIPSLISSRVTTEMNENIVVTLPAGLSKQTLKRWRDSLAYAVIEKPAHGKLSEYNTASDTVIYIPNGGYTGTDFFTYRMTLGSEQTNPATVAITILPATTGNAAATAAARRDHNRHVVIHDDHREDNNNTSNHNVHRRKQPIDEEDNIELGNSASSNNDSNTMNTKNDNITAAVGGGGGNSGGIKTTRTRPTSPPPRTINTNNNINNSISNNNSINNMVSSKGRNSHNGGSSRNSSNSKQPRNSASSLRNYDSSNGTGYYDVSDEEEENYNNDDNDDVNRNNNDYATMPVSSKSNSSSKEITGRGSNASMSNSPFMKDLMSRTSSYVPRDLEKGESCL